MYVCMHYYYYTYIYIYKYVCICIYIYIYIYIHNIDKEDHLIRRGASSRAYTVGFQKFMFDFLPDPGALNSCTRTFLDK